MALKKGVTYTRLGSGAYSDARCDFWVHDGTPVAWFQGSGCKMSIKDAIAFLDESKAMLLRNVARHEARKATQKKRAKR